MIPAFEPTTGNLPPGLHVATWAELEARYGFTERRRWLLAGLQAALRELEAAGCQRVYINGSFVTAKADPGDFDGCWELAGVDLDRLDPVLQDMIPPRASQKAKYHGELLIVDSRLGGPWTELLRFFQSDRQGRPKGIVVLELGTLP